MGFVNFHDATFASKRPRKCISSVSPIGCCDFSRFSSFFICVLESQNKSSQVKSKSVQFRSDQEKSRPRRVRTHLIKTRHVQVMNLFCCGEPPLPAAFQKMVSFRFLVTSFPAHLWYFTVLMRIRSMLFFLCRFFVPSCNL